MLLQDLYRNDPMLGQALARGLDTEEMARSATGDMGVMSPGGGARANLGRQAASTLGKAVAGFLREPDGPQIAAVSLDGLDTHASLGAAQGQLALRLGGLDALIEGLHTGLDTEWGDTAVLVVTEFGRSTT